MELTRIEEQLNAASQRLSDIAGDIKVVNTKLDDLKQLDHENRLKELEMWQATQRGVAKAIQIAIGFTGVLVGAGLKFLLN